MSGWILNNLPQVIPPTLRKRIMPIPVQIFSLPQRIQDRLFQKYVAPIQDNIVSHTIIRCTANINSQVAAIGCVMFVIAIWLWSIIPWHSISNSNGKHIIAQSCTKHSWNIYSILKETSNTVPLKKNNWTFDSLCR